MERSLYQSSTPHRDQTGSASEHWRSMMQQQHTCNSYGSGCLYRQRGDGDVLYSTYTSPTISFEQSDILPFDFFPDVSHE